MDAFVHELFVQMTERGFQARVVSIDHISSLQQEIEKRHRQNLFDKDFYQEYLSWFNFQFCPNCGMDLRGYPSAYIMAWI